MDASVVLPGDKTTHGGPVMSASSKIFIHSGTVAFMGDNVDCRKPGHGNNLNVECCSEQSEAGRAKGSMVALASPADGSFRALSVVAWVISWDRNRAFRNLYRHIGRALQATLEDEGGPQALERFAAVADPEAYYEKVFG